MAGIDDSNNTKPQPAPHEPRVLGRREVLKGLSTVPALGASGVRKRDHILDPGTGAPVRTRLGAWASVPRPRSVSETVAARQPPAAGAVTDALATAFMLLGDEGIEQVCEASPGLEAWIVEGATPPDVDDRVRHYGG